MKLNLHFSPPRSFRTLIRYFLSYFLILSVLLLSFFLIVQNQLSGLYLDKLTQQARLNLEKVSEQLNREMTNINQINDSLSGNVDLITSRHTNASYVQYLAYQEIEDYAVGNSLIDSIIYYDSVRDTVISSGKYVEYSDGVFHIYKNSASTDFEPEKHFDHSFSANQLIYIQDTDSDYLIYYPYSIDEKNYTVFFILNCYELQNILRSAASGEIANMVLLNSQGEIVVSSGESSHFPSLTPVEIQQGDYKIDESNSLLIGDSLYNGYRIASLVSNDILMNQVNTAFQRTYLILILLGFVGILLIALGMKSTYLPLHRLTKKIVPDFNPAQSYLDQLDRVYTTAITENQLLHEKLGRYRLSMQKSILDSILMDNGSVKASLNSIDPFFSLENNTLIFALKMKSPSGTLPTQDIARQIKAALPPADTCIPLEAESDSAVFLIRYSGNEQQKEDVLDMLIQDIYREQGYFSALSNGSHSPLDIPSLYENAALASDYWNQYPTVSFHKIASRLSKQPVFSYPYQTLEDLSLSLKSHAFATSTQHIRALFLLINSSSEKKNTLPSFFIHCVLIDILTIIANSMNEENIKFKSYSDLYFETLYFCRSCPFDEKKDAIQSNIQKLIGLFQEELEHKIINASQIQELLEKQVSSPDFSITVLADTFHVSIAYMSYLFKKEMGENFSDYIWTLRLKKAQELLTSSDFSIDEISLSVGYVNTSSFRRKFKQATGITPSQYRQEAASSSL